MLKASTVIWGTDVVLPGEPSITRLTDVVYRPFSKEVYFTEYPDWGITDHDGNLLLETAYTRGGHDELVGQAATRPGLATNQLNKAPDVTYIYGGPLIPHYGHFLLTSLSRLWAADQADLRSYKILFHSDHGVTQMMKTPYIRALLAATGLDAERFVTFSSNTSIETLIVPLPAFVEQKQSHGCFRDQALRIGASLQKDTAPNAAKRPLYISKTQLVGGVARCANEFVVEDLLSRNGIDIAYPEKFSLADQLAMFASRSVISGPSTSAFHSLVMLDRTPSLLSVSSRNLINSNFLILDKLAGISSSYLFDDNCRQTDQDAFIESYALADPVGHAKAILEWIDAECAAHTGTSTIPRVILPSREFVPDLAGPPATDVMKTLHDRRQPRTYLEVGTFQSPALKSVTCPGIAIGVSPVIDSEALANTPVAIIIRDDSEHYFASNPPPLALLVGHPIELALLNGDHQGERLLRDFVHVERQSGRDGMIVLHDCIPVELAMTDIADGAPLALPHRAGWWIGSGWRALLALKEFRTDLDVTVIDATPAGLVLVRGLDPQSDVIERKWNRILARMSEYDLRSMTLLGFQEATGLQPTNEALSRMS